MSPGQPSEHGGNDHWSGSSYRGDRMPYCVQSDGGRREAATARVRKFITQRIYEYLLPWPSHSYGIQAKGVHEVVRCIEETLFKIAASEEEYVNLDTLSSRIEVQLRRLTHHRQPSLQCNGASTSRMESTSNGLQFMPSSFGDCNMSDIRRFPNQMISDVCTTANYNQTSMIPNSSFLCNGTASTEPETISEVHAHQKPARPQSSGVQNDPRMQSVSFINNTDVSFSSKDQTFQFSNGLMNSGLGSMVHTSGPDMSETNLIQTAYNEPEQLLFDLHHQTGARYELCSTAPTVFENHYGSTSFQGWVKGDCTSDSSGMHMQCQSNLRSSLTPRYSRLPHPEEAVAIQSQAIDQSRNVNCTLPLSDTLGKLRGYDVHLNSQFQPKQNYALSMLETTTSGNGHMKVNKMSCLNYANYPKQSESQHLANENAPLPESEYKCVSTGIQPTEAIHSLQVPAEKPGTPCQPYLQAGSNGDLKNRDAVVLNKVSKEGSVAFETATTESTREPTLLRDATCTTKDLNEESINRKKRQLFLISLLHARTCTLSTVGKCPIPNCRNYKKLLCHIAAGCKVDSCSLPQCHYAKVMLTHVKSCKDRGCPVCAPVKRKIIEQAEKHRTPSGLNRVQCSTKIMSTVKTCEDMQQPPPKRLKTDVSEVCIPTTEKPQSGVSIDCTPFSAECPINSDDQCELIPPAKPELKKLNGGSIEEPSLVSQRDSEIDSRAHDETSVEALENITQDSVKREELLQISTKHAALPTDAVSESTAHPKVDCVSLTELFTPEQVRRHIISLRQWVDQSKLKADKGQSVEQSMNQNSCQLCAAEELNFEPLPVYCNQCGSRIKRRAVYYMLGTGDTRHYFCTTCHTATRGENFVVYGRTFSKCELEKKKNNEHIQEPWVQCDKCHGWQHQICALFNSRMNGEGQAKYTCPNCYVKEIERGDRLSLPQTAFLGAKDLPRTTLSDHIERRLHRRLQDSILLRTTTQGAIDEKVPGSADIIVRVVLSVDKKLQVKKNFLEIFQGHDYPAEFPYKSKVILLFQDFEGVEVCLFAMYVQEFGSECDFPNRRRVCISYLDSVRYFRPDVKLMTGEALRTFVYHEVLIGYLEYCKTRGFTSCYIWVCPPQKGEDYILYCHPEIQRTPKSDKLREWYLSMLRKAVKEDIVVEITNLYDHFFISTGESKAKVTAARLPYFDGDYWPGIAEEKLQQFFEEGDKAPHKKCATKKTFTKRSLRTTLQSDISDCALKDMFLIHEIGKIVCPMKEDFIMVHLHHACTHCRMFIISGKCWLCKQCSNFRLCDKCYEAEQRRDESDRHPLQHPSKHLLHPVKILNIPSDTKDVDEIIESEIFDTRHEFLKLCQGNHYQYDTLRRAKHSSMMLLYHLHNPTAPAFVTMCNICHLDIEAGRGLLCEVCFEYEICSRCYEKYDDSGHPHKLTKRSSSNQTQSREARASQVRKMNDLIVHVSDCHSSSCMYADCPKVKWLFQHGTECTKQALKGCVSCKKMWYLLQIHSKACLESKCRVPRCSDLKMHTRRLQQQSECIRRAAVTEMSRQRTTKVNVQS